MYLEENIRGLCDRYGLDYVGFLADMNVESPNELSILDLEIICEEYAVGLNALLFSRPFKTNNLKAKIEKIKLLVLDVDGVLTDGGMYFTESGDQFKKFNAKDGMAIKHLTKNNFIIAIISSAYKSEAVKARASMLGIQHCHITRDPKLRVLNDICAEHSLKLDEVAMIGDDINDIEVMQNIGLTACPANAVNSVMKFSDIVLNKNGGEGCVREFIDLYLLKEPLKN